MSSHSFSSSNPIALLAGVALINTPGELDNLHIPCRARSVSSAPESPIRPLRRSSTSNSLPCTPLLRPRCYSPSPRLSKPARGKLQARIKEDKVKRSHKIKCMISQASKIKSISNSPANPEVFPFFHPGLCPHLSPATTGAPCGVQAYHPVPL